MADVRIRYAFPEARLAGLIAAYLELRVSGEGAERDLLPPDVASICIPLSGRFLAEGPDGNIQDFGIAPSLTGSSSKPRWGIAEGGTAFMVGFFPLAWPMLLGTGAAQFSNRAAPLAEILGDAAGHLAATIRAADSFEARSAAADSFFVTRRIAEEKVPQAAAIRAIGKALTDPDCASVEELCLRATMSQPRLVRLCRAAFGFPPKLLLRRARFRRMIHRMDQHSYADWRDYIDTQYVDQSHLIRDFRFFMGMSPSQYMALRRPFVGAAFEAVRQTMAGGIDQGW